MSTEEQTKIKLIGQTFEGYFGRILYKDDDTQNAAGIERLESIYCRLYLQILHNRNLLTLPIALTTSFLEALGNLDNLQVELWCEDSWLSDTDMEDDRNNGQSTQQTL